MSWIRENIGMLLLTTFGGGACLIAGIVVRDAFNQVDYDTIDARNAIAKVVPDFDPLQADFNRTSSGFVVTFQDRTIVLDCYEGTNGLILIKAHGCNVSLVKVVKPVESEASP